MISSWSSSTLVLSLDAELAERLVDQARADGVPLTGEGGFLTGPVLHSVKETATTEIASQP